MKTEEKAITAHKKHKNMDPVLASVGIVKEELMFMILGGSKALKREVKSELDYLDLSINGLPKAAVINVGKYMNLSIQEMAELVNVSRKTLDRKKPTDLMKGTVGSQTIEIASTIAHGIEVFDTIEKFNAWSVRKNRALNEKAPIEVMNTPTGLKLVNAILTRIEEGVHS